MEFDLMKHLWSVGYSMMLILGLSVSVWMTSIKMNKDTLQQVFGKIIIYVTLSISFIVELIFLILKLTAFS